MRKYIETPRLILREWCEADILPFYQMNSDERVMEYFLHSLSEEESRSFYDRIQEEFSARGYGLYAVERKEDQRFIGYTGFHQVSFDVDFAPCVEIGWRLMSDVWGVGYACEAAACCLEYAKESLDFDEVVSFTALLNLRSERVMQKIDMQRIKEFDHPLVSPDHPLYRHVLYKIVL